MMFAIFLGLSILAWTQSCPDVCFCTDFEMECTVDEHVDFAIPTHVDSLKVSGRIGIPFRSRLEKGVTAGIILFDDNCVSISNCISFNKPRLILPTRKAFLPILPPPHGLDENYDDQPDNDQGPDDDDPDQGPPPEPYDPDYRPPPYNEAEPEPEPEPEYYYQEADEEPEERDDQETDSEDDSFAWRFYDQLTTTGDSPDTPKPTPNPGGGGGEGGGAAAGGNVEGSVDQKNEDLNNWWKKAKDTDKSSRTSDEDRLDKNLLLQTAVPGTLATLVILLACCIFCRRGRKLCCKKRTRRRELDDVVRLENIRASDPSVPRSSDVRNGTSGCLGFCCEKKKTKYSPPVSVNGSQETLFMHEA